MPETETNQEPAGAIQQEAENSELKAPGLGMLWSLQAWGTRGAAGTVEEGWPERWAWLGGRLISAG